jgi:mono/diheme cytochrome c family protein
VSTRNEQGACTTDGTTGRSWHTGMWSLLVAALASFLACGNEMGDQPSWKPQEMEVLLPAHSIPVTGREEPVTEVESYSALISPVAPDEASIKKGQLLFEKQCIACHGREGKGGGTMAEYFGEPPPLDDESNLELPDGFFYSTIRHGRGMMPALSEALSAEERWHIINYLRRLQNK